MHVQIADVPVPHVELNERISERMHEQIVDVPVPQKIRENVEPGSRDSAACGSATTGSSASNCGKDGGFPVDQACLFPRTQYIDKIVDMPVAMHRMVLRIQTGNKPSINHVTKHALFPQIRYIDKVIVDTGGVLQRQVPQILIPLKTVEVPPALFVGRVVEAPVIMQMRRLSLRQCRSFWKSPSFPSLRSKLLRWFSTFHKNAFQSALSGWMMSPRFRDGGRETEEEGKEEGRRRCPHRGLP